MPDSEKTESGSNSDVCLTSEGPPPPPHRALQVFAFDPGLELDLETARINRSVLQIEWEPQLKPGPVGEYLEVIDIDPASRCVYDPVDLNDPHLLARDGYQPSEGNPRFHQQMVYAVAMKTIGNFERALGRRVFWSPRFHASERVKGSSGYWWLRPAGETKGWLEELEQSYVPQLRIYPHALREANAYYSPDKRALLFGYFNAQNTDARESLPGGIVFSCLSHDIIAHEMTHAILDGIHGRLLEPSNPDVLAFHEGFADLVAIFQHFTLPGVLEHQIATTRGDLDAENLLAKLAVQFGHATNRHDALRDALGQVDPATGDWRRSRADPSLIGQTFEPHARGALLVAAVFDAFLAIYESHTTDLLRIASGGTGVLPDGEFHPDLVGRLADEAGRVAQRLLTICLRALDYLPPVDVTFGDYLRAMITIDSDMVPDDPRRYRVAILRAFRDWGIYPRDVRTLSVESLRWKEPDAEDKKLLAKLLPPVKLLRDMAYASGKEQFSPYRDKANQPVWVQNMAVGESGEDRRRFEYLRERQFAAYLHDTLARNAREYLNTFPADKASLERERLAWLLGIDLTDDQLKFEVQAIRPTTRIHKDGRTKIELLVLITQRRWSTLTEPAAGSAGSQLNYKFRGGCTLLIDPDTGTVRYAITKGIDAPLRRKRQERFLRKRLDLEGLGARARYGVWMTEEQDEKVPQEPFRLLHGENTWEDWL